jgi:hypothetical protein
MKLPKLKGSLFTCGRCRKSYSSPFGHVCISSRSFSAGRRRLAPHAEVECPNCGKALGNPLTHRCPSKAGDFRRRRAAHKKRQADAARRAAAAKRKREAHDPPRCTDDGCQRTACAAYKQGREEGYSAGHDDGYAAGYAAGAASTGG